MEMERINENTIRVLIENEDLAERGITFLDLLGNHKQIESFFYSILEEVDVEEQFQETEAVTFQVLPNRNGIELFISKNMMLGDDADLPELSDLINQDSFGDFLKNQLDSGADLAIENTIELKVDNSLEEVRIRETNPTLDYVVKFEDFDDLVTLSTASKFELVQTNLYSLASESKAYYLHLSFPVEDMTEEQVNDDLSLVLEFGTLSNVTPEVLGEYGRLIMERSALEQVKHYFKK
ncbi:adaptor protein MecA [Vagococcus coleopterorum]|uniref:Adapter protein MecA n=1 Tax=Vagococcus coleopterorum TaxID=2714946 RepID=A0A6G8ALE3_9ENTE|nr:adaptor protein MecA [Vagococcus coleopterorum]QIL45779.1 adaptor protein MecA [Vagococcus coleopterorum]